MSFAHMKRRLILTRLKLRGLCGANDEFVMENHKKLVRLRGQPPPELRIAVSGV